MTLLDFLIFLSLSPCPQTGASVQRSALGQRSLGVVDSLVPSTTSVIQRERQRPPLDGYAKESLWQWAKSKQRDSSRTFGMTGIGYYIAAFSVQYQNHVLSYAARSISHPMSIPGKISILCLTTH